MKTCTEYNGRSEVRRGRKERIALRKRSVSRTIDRIFSVGIDRGTRRSPRKRLPGEGKVIGNTLDCHYGKASRVLMLGSLELVRFQNSRLRRNKEQLRRTLTHRQRQNAGGVYLNDVIDSLENCTFKTSRNFLWNVVLILKQSALSLARKYLTSPNADRREGAPPLARVMPCRDRPVEC
ncbi:hypothetical protein ALC57_05560 [Trachymyrmex cornetzi]|uniref:Uncharacterized protein n=1 Tax=Trachymyrmex cornetzi TaxID=471704 RepID=A0A151JAF8_9HYME|nr:hypothetical protein ALC57_05560 [Trachymyrmex cornetzi]